MGRIIGQVAVVKRQAIAASGIAATILSALVVISGPVAAGEPGKIVLTQYSVQSQPLPAPVDPYNPDRRYAAPSGRDDAYRPSSPGGAYRPSDGARADDAYRPPRRSDSYNQSAEDEPRGYRQDRREYGSYDERPREPSSLQESRTYSENEIVNTGHHFFGSVSEGLARAIEQLFRKQGRPNGYILGEDAGGAFIAGLRYGEGRLYTKDAGVHKVFWQGPSVGYDFGGEGSKTMVLVYNLRDPADIYHRFGGVQGSAYMVGGVGVQLQKHEHVLLAPIRSGIGLRIGANVGYLKYTRRPTWNPF